MPRRDFAAIDDVPARAVHVAREQAFLTTDHDCAVKSARGDERGAPDDRRSGHEAEQPRARQFGIGREGALGHAATDGVLVTIGADEDARGDDADARMSCQQLGAARQRTWFPEGVVIGERDIGRGDGRNAEIARGRTEIALALDQPHLRVTFAERARRAVIRTVVDDDDLRGLIEPHDVVERAFHLRRAIPRNDDHRGLHRPSFQ